MTCHGRFSGTFLASCWLFSGLTTLAFLRTSSSVEPLFAISGAEIFGFLSNSVLYGRLLMDSGREKFFSVALFLVVSGRLVSGPAFCVDIRNFDFCLFVRNYFLMGSVMQNLLPENFAVIRCLVFFLSVCRLCGGCFAIFGGSIFVLGFGLVNGLLVLSVRSFGSLSRAFPLRLSSIFLFFLFFFRLVLSFWGSAGAGASSPCSAFSSWRGGALLRSRCRRCRQELAHDSAPSLPPFLLLAVLPPFPPRRGRPPLLPAVFLFSCRCSFLLLSFLLCCVWLLVIDS